MNISVSLHRHISIVAVWTVILSSEIVHFRQPSMRICRYYQTTHAISNTKYNSLLHSLSLSLSLSLTLSLKHSHTQIFTIFWRKPRARISIEFRSTEYVICTKCFFWGEKNQVVVFGSRSCFCCSYARRPAVQWAKWWSGATGCFNLRLTSANSRCT